MNIKEVFTTKVGPLPAIAWAGMAGVGYYVYARRKASNAGPAPLVSTGSAGDPLMDSGSSPGYSDGAGNYYGSATMNPTNVGTGDATISDNSTWGKRAADWLIAQGISPSDAQTAIANYLYGTGENNGTQASALNLALQHLGTPPGGVIAPPPVTPQTPVTPPAPPAPPAPVGAPYVPPVLQPDPVNPVTGLTSTQQKYLDERNARRNAREAAR